MMYIYIYIFSRLVYPVDRNPLVFVTQSLHCLDDLSECYVEIIVDHHHIDVFVVFALQ